MTVGIVYSSRHGQAKLLVMISSFVLLLPSYSDCTPIAIVDNSGIL
jgi:hypothetical protein